MHLENDNANGTNIRESIPTILAVIPAYNEERFIASTVLRVRKLISRVVVIDDGSRDATAALAAEAGAEVLRLPQNQGKSAALQAGFQFASSQNLAAVVVIDADGQHIPEELPRLLAPILERQADIVIGSRYLQNASHVPRSRVFAHRFFNFLTGIASGETVTDSQSGFRALSPRAVSLMQFQSSRFAVESEMQFIAHQNQLKVVEVPVTICYPDPPKRSATLQGVEVLNKLLFIVGQYRPLLFFGISGMLILLSGITGGVIVVDIYRRSQQLAVGYAMVSVLLSILGTVGLSTGLILHSVRGLLMQFRSDFMQGQSR